MTNSDFARGRGHHRSSPEAVVNILQVTGRKTGHYNLFRVTHLPVTFAVRCISAKWTT